jgi:hypothetical protein
MVEECLKWCSFSCFGGPKEDYLYSYWRKSIFIGELEIIRDFFQFQNKNCTFIVSFVSNNFGAVHPRPV